MSVRYSLVPIGEFVQGVSSVDPAKLTWKDEAFTYVDLSAVDNESKTIVGERHISAAGAPSRARQLLKAGDIVVSTVRPNLNAVAVIPDRLHGSIGSTGFCVLRCEPDHLNNQYLFHWLRTPAFVAQMVRLATGQSYPAVSDAIIERSTLPLPRIEEQRRIAAILDQAEALRSKRRQALAKLDTLTQSLFLEMFGDPGNNPKQWESQEIGEVADVQGGLQVTPSRRHHLIQAPYLRVANVYRERLDLNEVKTMGASPSEFARTQLKRDDLLIVEGHGNPAEIGRCAVWDGSISRCIHQNHLIRVRFNHDILMPSFGSSFLNSPVGRSQLLRAAKTTSGLNTINVSNVKRVKLMIPPLTLQTQYDERSLEIQKAKNVVVRQQERLSFVFASLQHRAFHGEL